MNGWTDRAWVAERRGRYPYVIWDIPDVRDTLIADYEKNGWTVHGPYELPPNAGGREGRLLAERAHRRAVA